MIKVIIGIVVIIFVAAGAYILISQRQQQNGTQNSPQTTQTAPEEVVPTENQRVADLQAGGSSYRDPESIFVLLYPNDYQMDTQGNGDHVRFFKRGATQTGQTELFDGVLMVFETENIGNQSLSDWVDARIQSSTADGTLEVIEPKKSITLNGAPGFTYKTRGLGEAEYYVVQKDANSQNAVVITTSVNDPENVGYQAEVDAALSTVQLLK